MTGRCDEVEERMNTVVSKPRIPFDSGLFRKNVVVLSFQVAHDLAKSRLVVNLTTETGGVDNGQSNSSAFFVELKF